MTLLAFMCLGVAVKGFSQYDISKTTLKVDWQMNAPFSTDFADKLSGWGMSYELGYQLRLVGKLESLLLSIPIISMWDVRRCHCHLRSHSLPISSVRRFKCRLV